MYNTFDPNKSTRNYNCRVRESVVNGVKQLSLDNRYLHVSVLPGKGTDIVEFLHKPLDLDAMYHSWTGVRDPARRMPTSPDPGGVFFDTYEGGWQELFPSIGTATTYRGAKLPFHGEVHSLNWDYCVEKDAEDEVTVKFSVRTIRTPYLLEKWLTLRSDEPALHIRERATNEGMAPLQFSWGHHPALGPAFLDGSCTIELPAGEKRLHPYPGTRLKPGDYRWPNAMLDDGAPIDLSKVLPPEKKCPIEFGVTGLREGNVEVRNHNHGLAFGLKWDVRQLPCIWFWEPDCGGQDYPSFGRDYCLGVEPWTNLPEPLASLAERGAGVHIAPGETKELELTAYCRTF